MKDITPIRSFLETAKASAAVPAAAAPAPAESYPSDFVGTVYQAPLQAISGPEIVIQQPLAKFQGDIVIPPNTTQIIDIFSAMGSNCVGFNIIGVVDPVFVSINGGGLRTIPASVVFDESVITNLTVVTQGLGCIVQLNGV